MNDLDRRALLGAAGLAGVAAMAKAGPIDPPAGPVSPTLKPLSEVEPRIAVNATNTPGDANYLFKITQPGSYYLTGNITGVSGKGGIQISSFGVTLDLAGFEIVGPGTGTEDGINVTGASLYATTVRNGSVRNWGTGLNLGATGAIKGCTASGIHAVANLLTGINGGPGCLITDCVATGNGVTGIAVNNGGTVLRCTSIYNGRGYLLQSVCTISHSSANGNTGRGIEAGAGCMISECVSGQNGSEGAILGAAAHATACNFSLNTGSGLVAATGMVTAAGCTAYGNGVHGFDLVNDSTIIDSTAMANSSTGIRCASSCRVRRCSVRGTYPTPASTGILITGPANLLEGNSVIAAATGIKITNPGNKLIRNTCSANTSNWDVLNGNYCFVVIGASSGVISGNAGGVASGISDPDANYSY